MIFFHHTWSVLQAEKPFINIPIFLNYDYLCLNYSTGYQVFFHTQVKEVISGFPLSNSTGALGTCSTLNRILLLKIDRRIIKRLVK